MAAPRRPGVLRTKSGCLTCRGRRKKCDETGPSCKRCSRSQRECIWPGPDDMIDGRHTALRSQRDQPTPLCVRSEKASLTVARCNLESFVSRHFVEKYYGLIINPDSHPAFNRDWLVDIQAFMEHHQGLRFSVLANGASHLYLADDTARMQDLALSYYSKSMRGLSRVFADPSLAHDHNATLTAIMLLYLHGCMGLGTYLDTPCHVDAAIRIVKLRFLQSESTVITRPFDRLAIESVLFQVFLLTMGLWGGSIKLQFTFDLIFWDQCESLLGRSVLFPGASNTCNSPVLGAPLAVFKILLVIKQLWSGNCAARTHVVDGLREELARWESWVMSLNSPRSPSVHTASNTIESISKDAASILILSASLLVEQLDHGVHIRGPPQAATPDAWQLRAIVSILRRRQGDIRWQGCYLGNWPVYTAGFLMSSIEEVELVRAELEQRWKLISFSQVDRFWKDLELTWSERGSEVWVDDQPCHRSQTDQIEPTKAHEAHAIVR